MIVLRLIKYTKLVKTETVDEPDILPWSQQRKRPTSMRTIIQSVRRSNEHLHTHRTINRDAHDDDNPANSLISMLLDSGATDCHVSPKRTRRRLLEGKAHDQVSMMVDLMMFEC